MTISVTINIAAVKNAPDVNQNFISCIFADFFARGYEFFVIFVSHKYCTRLFNNLQDVLAYLTFECTNMVVRFK